jgi:Rad3-related DNA helicase
VTEHGRMSAGRAIRHASDHAAIVLLDRRYTLSAATAKLPQWLARDLEAAGEFGKLMAALVEFRKRHAARQ